MPFLRIGLIQMVCEKGEIVDNLEQTAKYIQEASEKQVDFLVFPEMSITGYVDPTQDPSSILSLNSIEVNKFVQLTQGYEMAVIAGIIENSHFKKPYITQIIANNGNLMGYYRKITIIDEEVLWFVPGDELPVFVTNEFNYSLAICADIDNEELFASYQEKGVNLIFHPSAPGLYGDQQTRNWRTGFDWWSSKCITQLGHYAKKYHLWIAVATQAGRTCDEDFPGGGFVFAPDGRCLFQSHDWHPGAIYLEIDLGSLSVKEI